MSSSLSPARPWTRAIPFALGRRLVTVGAFALVAGTAFANGGYFPSSWGWPTLGAAWAAGLAAAARERAALSRTAGAAAALLALLTAWTVVGTAWSTDVTQTALEAERTAVYAAALLAALLWAGRRPQRLLHGTWAAIAVVCSWSLLTRLVPDHFGIVEPVAGYRLAAPIGYWNSLGLFAGIGALLALGLAARAETRTGRAAAAASLPLLLTTVYFTYSRGAWVAFGLGLLGMLLVDRRRLQLSVVLLAVAPWPALAVLRAATYPALTTRGAALPEMAGQGHRLLLQLAALALAGALAAIAVAPLARLLVFPDRLRLHAAVALILALAAAVAVFSAREGSPLRFAQREWNAFARAAPAAASGANLNSRLFHLSGSGRVTQWEVAWRQVQAHPLRGSGAGTFGAYWTQHRPTPFRVRDVHNLYLEALAELGPLGLLLLAGAFGLPLVAAFRARGRPLTAAAFGACVAYLLHAAVDWDWELAAVTLAFVLCAAALLASTPRRREAVARPPRRTLVAATAVVLGLAGLYTIATRVPLARLDAAAAAGRWTAAESDARTASRLAPWSSEPWLWLGEDELGAGRTGEARAAFAQAVAASPGSWVAWYDLARVSSGPARAAALDRARRLNPLGPELAALRP